MRGLGNERNDRTYRVLIKYCVLSKNIQYSATFPSPALGWVIGCTENGQPIRVTVYTQISDQMSCSPTCRGWVAMKWGNTQFLMNTLYKLSDMYIYRRILYPFFSAATQSRETSGITAVNR